MAYNRYPVNMTDPDGPAIGDYISSEDYSGGIAFMPTQCFKNNSFMIEKVPAPIIATIGDETDPAMALMLSYMKKLIDIQEFLISHMTP